MRVKNLTDKHLEHFVKCINDGIYQLDELPNKLRSKIKTILQEQKQSADKSEK
jgi:hypothetical protein